MTQTKLAELAGLGLSTVVDFEEEASSISRCGDMTVFESALKRAGVEFIDENGGGSGVRLRKRQQNKG